jgi:glycosyltransferase involved in cell wall biosynthesis
VTATRAGPPEARDRVARVALFLPSLAGGGAERITLNLARELRSAGNEVDLVLASVSGPYVPEVPDGVRIVDLGGRRTLGALPALAAYLHRTRPAALLSAMNHANIVAVWAARLVGFRGRLLLAEHNELPSPERSLWQRAFNAAMRLSYPHAHRVIAVSEGVRDSLVQRAGVRADHIEVIYNPVLSGAMDGDERPRPPEIPADGLVTVLGVGRLTRQKNFPNLLRAFALVRRRREARLVILGEGEERRSLTELIESLGLTAEVALPGFVPNPYDYLAHADLFVLSSDWEGLPTVLIEALALGIRVVATDCASGPREILADGAYGRIVPLDDSEALAEAILTALDEPPIPSPREWLERFTVEAAASRYSRALGIEVSAASNR